MEKSEKTNIEELISSVFTQNPGSLSSRVESLVLGVLRFLIRLFYTLWQMLRHPKKFVLEAVLSDEPAPQYIPPYTFLTLCGFVFTITMTGFPHGAWEFFNGSIWAADNISKHIQDKWQDSLTLTTLVLAAFPVLITVGLIAQIWSRFLWEENCRQRIAWASVYSFGFAGLLFCIPHIALASSFIPNHFNLELEPTSSLILFFTGFLALPIIGLICSLIIQLQTILIIEHTENSKRWIKLLLTPFYLIAVFIASSYAASIPGAYQEYQASLLPEKIVSLKIGAGPELVLGKNSDDDIEISINFGFVVQNHTSTRFVGSTNYLEAILYMDLSGWETDKPLGLDVNKLQFTCSSPNTYNIIVEPQKYIVVHCVALSRPNDEFLQFLQMDITEMKAERHLRIDPRVVTSLRTELRVDLRNTTNMASDEVSVAYRFE